MRARVSLLVLFTVFACPSCTDARPGGAASESSAESANFERPHVRESDLTRAAEHIIAFLRGRDRYDSLAFADTVTLLLSPSGGGDQARVAGADLRHLERWKISTPGQHFSLVPPHTATELTTRLGTHFNCLEYSLSSLYPELAHLPHVGTNLQPPDAESCLQSWNLTLVFTWSGAQPVLHAVVYDQWEW